MAHVLKPPCAEDSIRAKPANAPCTREAAPWVLFATILGSSLGFIDGTVVNVALPTIQRDFAATAGSVQWVIEAYSLFLAALILVGGSLGDRLGRRRVFSAGIVLFTAASVVCGLAPNLLALILARAVQGIGGALLIPGSLAIISASFDDARRGAAIGTWAAFTTITSAVGPVLGGWLVQTLSWRWVFFINVPLAAITLAATFLRVPESRDEGVTGRLDVVGAGLATLGLGALVFGLIESSALGLGAPLVVAAIVVGIAALIAFVWVEARAERPGSGVAPMVPLRLFRSRTFSGTNLLTLLLYGALGGALYFVPFNLQQVQGYSPAEAGAALLPMTLVIFALSRWAGGLIPRFGAKLPLVVGPTIAAAGFALFAVPSIGGSYWTTYFPAILVLSLGMAIVIAPLTTAVMGAVSTSHAGVASGVNNAVSRAAGLLAIAILNLVVVAVFASAFQHGLAPLPLDVATRQSLIAQSGHLAAVQLPPGLSASTQAAVQQAVNTSYVAGFRVAMLIAAGLALASAVVAGILVEGKATAHGASTEDNASVSASR
ncbi:MAG TPA: MFS transporter [Ktedonobacterales bacterium]|nr:MFS transporter [Ktedonobacterales bacterium]